MQDQPSHLFSPLRLRDVTLLNRIAVSPMCQYSANDGLLNDWHFVHLGSRAVGGAGLILLEATAVSPEGRISPWDLGIWNDMQIDGFARVVEFMNRYGTAAGIQLGHAGRKASMSAPWEAVRQIPPTEGGWTDVIGASAVAFSESHPTPRAMEQSDIERLQTCFVTSAQRAVRAGFQVLELHAAHGYIFHQFLSPLSNRRTDAYGGSFENRARLLLETVSRVREVWPSTLPLLVRVSATDWLEGGANGTLSDDQVGWTLQETIALVAALRLRGVDLVDVSSGGNVKANIPVGSGYQTRFAEQIRRETGVATGAVGLITSAPQADHIIRSQQADMVLLARELLRDPYWPLRAAEALRQEMSWPVQYQRASHDKPPARQPYSSGNLLTHLKGKAL